MGNQPSVLSVNKDDRNLVEETLSEAMENEKSVIVIKNPGLRAKVAIGMTLAEWSQNVALVAAMGSILCVHNDNEFAKPLAVISVATNLGYYVLWRRCPLSHYRIASRPTFYRALTREEQLNTVLVREMVPKTFRLAHVLTSATAFVLAFYEDVSSLGEKIYGMASEVVEAKDGDGSE